MTNGEKLVKVFPDINLYKKNHSGIQINFDSVWWNAEYKEPTTPNDCETCIHNKGVLECDMYGCKYEPTTKNDVPDTNVGKIGSTTKNDLAVDAISRQFMYELGATCIATRNEKTGNLIALGAISELPSVTPQLSSELEKNLKKLEKDFGELDCISRKAVQTRLKEIINEMETIFADIREREGNDSVCGLCEYDCDHGLDGFANECPGFEKDDCFKLNEKYKAEWLDISNLPSLTPQEPKIRVLERDEALGKLGAVDVYQARA